MAQSRVNSPSHGIFFCYQRLLAVDKRRLDSFLETREQAIDNENFNEEDKSLVTAW